MTAITVTWACTTLLSLAALALIHPWRARDILHDAAIWTACLTATALPLLANRT